MTMHSHHHHLLTFICSFFFFFFGCCSCIWKLPCATFCWPHWTRINALFTVSILLTSGWLITRHSSDTCATWLHLTGLFPTCRPLWGWTIQFNTTHCQKVVYQQHIPHRVTVTCQHWLRTRESSFGLNEADSKSIERRLFPMTITCICLMTLFFFDMWIC